MKAQTPKRTPLRPPSPLNAGTPSLLRIDALQTSHQEEIAHLQNSYDERLRSLATFLPLGLAQLAGTALILAGAILFGLPEYLERFIPLDAGLINIYNPTEASRMRP